MMEPATIESLGRAFRNGDLRPSEVAQHYLGRIARLDGKLGAFTAVTAERAMKEAARADATFARGEDGGPLQGIPYAVKEHFAVAGVPTMLGCRFLADNIPDEDCEPVRRLREAGMVLLGKTHTVQLGGGITGINQDVGTPRNPWKEEHHVPGGSSSGSGVAVAADLVPVALGGDTGGSVRVPASLCGTLGLKTTIGRISRAGVHPMSVTLDTVGVLSRCAADAAAVYDALAGPDPADASTLAAPEPESSFPIGSDVRGLRIAVVENLVFDDVDPEVEAAVRTAAKVFESFGATLSSRVVPELDEIHRLTERYVINAVETYVHNEPLLREHGDRLDPIVGWIAKARDIPAREYFRVQKLHADIKIRVAESLADVDLLLLPATLLPALPVAEIAPNLGRYVEPYKDDPTERYTRNMSLGNMLGLCGLSLPCGFTEAGLPIGLGLYAKPFEETVLLRAAAAYETATDWHLRRPDLTWSET